MNTDREKDIAREFGVKSLPSCKLFRHGKPVEQVHGMQTEADYRELIERRLAPLARRVQAVALRAWQGGDRDEGDPGARRRRIGRGLMGFWTPWIRTTSASGVIASTYSATEVPS